MLKYFAIPITLVSVALVFWATYAVGEQSGIEVIYVSGTVSVCEAGGTEYSSAEEGMAVEAQDKIKTGDNSYAEIGFDEKGKNVVRINSNTDAVLLLKENEKIELVNGEAFSTINNLPSGSSFEVRTPTAVIGARGTDWTTKADKENTVVEAFESDLYVKSIEKDGSLSREVAVIKSGNMTSIGRFQKPAPMQKLPDAARARWGGLKNDVRMHADDAIMKRGPLGRPRNPAPGVLDSRNKGPMRSDSMAGPAKSDAGAPSIPKESVGMRKGGTSPADARVLGQQPDRYKVPPKGAKQQDDNPPAKKKIPPKPQKAFNKK